MAISDHSSGDSDTPLLVAAVDAAADYKGLPAVRSSSGGWRSASFIIGVEVAERFAFYGIESNLISYLTGPLGQSTAKAAASVNAWSGTASILPLLGGFVADSFLGRYRMIVTASSIYILGLGLLTLSTVLPSPNTYTDKVSSSFSPKVQAFLFFFSIYLVALAQGGHKPCVQAFGADQFDRQDPKELKAKSSFFNWWYFSMCMGLLTTIPVLNYIQDYLSWGLGFGIPCVAMVAALFVFLLGTKTYRFSVKGDDERSPFLRIGQVFVTAIRNRRTTSSAVAIDQEARGTLPHAGFEQFRFLNKALIAPDGSKQHGKVCTISEVEEAKSVLSLVTIWSTCLVYAIVFAQPPTFFTKQGATMDRSIGQSFTVPPASLQCLISLSTVLFIPVYDRVLVPTARILTAKPNGITMLQRIGTGLLLSLASMLIAGIVEIKRLEIARQYKLVDTPNVTVPMSVAWLVPQYVLTGIANVFTMVGLQEFFYDQVPNELRSVGLSLYLSIFGVGSFLSSFLVSAIDEATGKDGRDSWFANNLNRAHLDYFFFVLAGINAIGFALFLHFARSYIYNRKSTT